MNIRLWWLTKDGDRSCLQLYRRHYSSRKYKDGRNSKLFCGPGDKLVLRTAEGDAFFVWRRFIDGCVDKRTGKPQAGVNCAVFRNESKHQSSELIRQAGCIADRIWPGLRRYTYVNPKAVRSNNPGFCFECAGWVRCGYTKGGLLIMEQLDAVANNHRRRPDICYWIDGELDREYLRITAVYRLLIKSRRITKRRAIELLVDYMSEKQATQLVELWQSKP